MRSHAVLRRSPLGSLRIFLGSLFVGLLLTASACASSPFDQARQTLSAIDATVAATARALDAYDESHQLELVAQAKASCSGDHDCADARGKELLGAYRDKWTIAHKALVALDAASKVAELVVTAAELARTQGFDVAGLLHQLEPAARDVVAALKVIGFAPPGLVELLGSVA